MSLKEFLGLANMATSCNVRGCDKTEDIELVILEPFDPIDHSSKTVAVCPKHQEWAEERNEFAERMTDKMREYRAKIANEHAEEAERLATPADAELDGSTDIEMEEL